MATTLKQVPVSLIRQSKVLLRQIDKEKAEYQELRESVRARGLLNPISVREIPPEAEGGPVLYSVIDGSHRFNVCQDLGLETIPAQVMSMTDAEVEEAQIVANVHKVETKPVEYTKALERIIQRNPFMTEAELAQLVNKSPAWIKERFSLLRLEEQLQTLVDSGDIKLVNGYALAKLPAHEQLAFQDRAITMAPNEFSGLVLARAKELKQAAREGRDASSPDEFIPVATIKPKADLIDEQANGTRRAKILSDANAKNAEQGFKAALDWVLNLDPEALAVQRARHDQRVSVREENRKKFMENQAARRLENARKKLAEAEAEAEAAKSKTPATAGA